MIDADLTQIIRITIIATFWLLFFWCIVSSVWTSLVSRRINHLMAERKKTDTDIDRRLKILEKKCGRNDDSGHNSST